MPVNKGRVRLLVAALQSGLYEKSVGRLHRLESENKKEGWCCLGVASDVAAKFGLDLHREIEGDYGSGSRETFDGKHDYMPSSVREWYGFDSANPDLRTPDGKLVSAATLNDSGYVPEGEDDYKEVSLKEIGKFFRDTYLKK